ncbi:MAG: hypothetical protein KDM91_16265 [Verrucomicrobiae bacterium]|nr:hypothetical protein [Verrucomicrobiae bacterium]
MPDAAEKIVQLRGLLRERFPAAHRQIPPPPPLSPPTAPASDDDISPLSATSAAFPLGVKALDALGAVEPGTIVEMVGRRPGCGAGLLVAALARAAVRERRHLALIDGADAFDSVSAGLDAADCRFLLWLRCGRRIENALKAADRLLRDGNLPRVVMDLQLCDPRAIRLGLAAAGGNSAWHRLRGLAEKTGAVLAAFTPEPTIPCARLRLELRHRWSLDDLDRLPADPAALAVDFEVTRRVQPPAAAEPAWARAG